jgi:hypothetical protein
MQNHKIGPLLTLAAVALVGGGLWLANVSQETDPPAPATPVGQPTATTSPASPAPPQPSALPPIAFPAKANYVGKIPTAAGTITLEVTIDGQKAIAYACDGNVVEVWLRGSASNGALALANKDQTSRLTGRIEGTSIAGTLTIGAKSWDFTASPVQPPAGLYVSEGDGVRNSWIVDSVGAVTGVQRRADGSTGPAPTLTTDGTAVMDSAAVTATKVEGDDDVE